MKTRFVHMAATAALVSLLGGCETIDSMFKSNDEVVVINAADTSASDTPPAPPPVATPAPGQPYGGTFDPNNLMSVYNQISRGGVQMYDPNNPAAYPSLTNAGGIPAPQDSRVTVYPVGGDYYGQDTLVGSGSLGGSVGGSYGGGFTSPSAPYIPGNTQIFFGHGSSRLSGSDQQKLEQVAEQAKFSPVDRISVEGHASSRAETGDPVSDRAANLKESMNRTFAVTRSLMSKGVPAEKIRATSWGDTRNPPDMPEDQARRVDIYTGGGY